MLTRFLLAIIFIFSGIWAANSQVTADLANIDFDICGVNLPESQLNLGDFTISEALMDDFSIGTHTFYIEAPTNFEILATIATNTGSDISAVSVSQDTNTARLLVNLTVSGETTVDVLTIENVRIHNTISAISTDYNLKYVLNGNPNGLNGFTDNGTIASVNFNSLIAGTGVSQNICDVSNLQSISVTGSNVTQSRTYEWFIEESSGWTAIASSNTEILAVSSTTFPRGISKYRRTTTVTINGETCILTSSPATIVLNELYAGSITEGNSQSICIGEIPTQLSSTGDIATSSSGTSTYQWYKNDSGTWDLITGANDNYYQPSALSVTTSYKRRFTNTLNGFTCFKETNPISVLVSSVTNGGTANDQNICSLSDLQLLSINNGDTDKDYQWQRNNLGNWEDIAGATATTFNASSATQAGVNEFRRVTTSIGESCEGISTTATITYINFNIGSISGAQTVCYNVVPNLFTSDVETTGEGTITYQWEANIGSGWNAISGATTASYQTSALQETTQFRRLDTATLNAFSCSDYTNEITITVLDEIVGGTSSADQTICAGDLPTNLTISGGSTAGANISFQWQSATDGSFTNMLGETDVNLSFAVSPSVTTEYRRQTTITNSSEVCISYSTETTVFVNSIVTGTIGNDQDVCAGETLNTIINTTNTTATGTLSYVWEASTNNGTSWAPISGATGATYSPGTLTASTQLRRQNNSTLNGQVCSSVTNSVTITIAGEIEGGNSSADQTVCEDELPQEITITDGTPPGTDISFQWFSSIDGITYNAIVGETSEGLTFSSALSETTYFKRKVGLGANGINCEAFSTVSIVTVINLTAGEIGQSATVCENESVPTLTSTVNAVSNGTINYQWQESVDGDNWSDITLANQPTYTPAITTNLNQYYRRVAIASLSGVSCEVESTAVLISLNQFEDANTHQITFDSGATGNTVICNGATPQPFSVNFQLIASGSLSYQWQLSTDNITFNDISGANSASYAPGVISNDSYFRRITTTTLNGVSCSTTSNTLELINGGNADGGSVRTTGLFGFTEEVVCFNGDPSLIEQESAALGQTLTYQWTANGAPIPGATDIDYDPPTGILETTIYIRTTISTDISNASCYVNSNEITVLVPAADDIGPDITLCSNTSVGTLGTEGIIEGISYLSFQWYESTNGTAFSAIPGAINSTYTPSSTFTTNTFYRRGYTATVSGLSCGPEKFSNTIEIIVNDVAGGSIAGEQDICFGNDPAQFTENTAGTATGILSYQWFASEDNTNWSVIDDAVDSTYDAQADYLTSTYFKRTTYSTLNDVTCEADSNIILLGVADEIKPGVLTADQTVCIGETALTLTVTDGSTYSDQVYTWYSSPDGLVWTDLGVTTASYAPGVPTQTLQYKRTISRTSFGSLSCAAETNVVTVFLNSVTAGSITEDQSVCEGSQPDPLVELISATAAGALTYLWLSSEDNQTYSPISGATQQDFTPPSTLTTSTYFKRRAISTLNGVDCFAETSPKLITVIPYPIIDNELIILNDIKTVSCFDGDDGSIIIPNGRITGGNSAIEQINSITLTGTPEMGVVYGVIINGIAYEHEVSLNGSNVTETNNEIAAALADEINTATGASLSEALATTNLNEITLTAKIAGIPFTVYASTGSATAANAISVLIQANGVPNTYEWIKIGDTDFSASTLSIENLEAGVYQLTVYNSFCGVSSEPFLVAEPDQLTLTIGDTCNTAITAYSTGGVAPFTYTLTGPNGPPLVEVTDNTNLTYSDLTPGASYTLTVKDDSCDIIVAENTTLPTGLEFDVASVVVENSSCYNVDDGSISLNIGNTTVTGGFPPYKFNWTGPDNASYTTPNLSDLAPGVYVLDVEDQLGCTTSFTTNIATKAELKITNVQIVNEQLACANVNDAEIGIQISADANSQIEIKWYKNEVSFASNVTYLSALGAGTYKVVVIDINSNGASPCETSESFEITTPDLFVATEIESAANCYDPDLGRSFTVKVEGGTAPYQYSLNNGTPVNFTTLETTISGLGEQAYSIEVTDAKQCNLTTFNLDSYVTINYTGATTVIIPPCSNSSMLTLNTSLVEGGSPYLDANNAPYYLYDWRGPNNFSAQDITTFDALPGEYRLTITDSKGCSSEVIEFEVSPTYPDLEVVQTISQVGCGAINDGEIAVEISGGKRPYAILWEKEIPGSTENPNSSFSELEQNVTQLSDLTEGRYRLTITSDIIDCDEDNTAYYYQEIITVSKEESLKLTDGPYLDNELCAGNPGIITLSVFNTQGGDLSFYYNDLPVSATETLENTYEVKIADPVEETLLNVVNDKGCGFTAPISTAVISPSFDFTSEEFERTGLYLTKEEIQFANTSELGYDKVVWNFGDDSLEQTLDSETSGNTVTHSFDYPGIFEVSLTLFNINGCSQTLTQSIQIGSGYDVIFPTAFSANADSINDYFQAEFTGIASFTFEIYDLWGGLVYSVSYDYEDQPANWGWDGTYSNGKQYSNKSFRYLFVGTTKDNNQITRTGEATILR